MVAIHIADRVGRVVLGSGSILLAGPGPLGVEARTGRIGEVDRDRYVAAVTPELGGRVRVAAAGVPDPMDAKPVDGEEAHLAELARPRDVVDADSRARGIPVHVGVPLVVDEQEAVRQLRLVRVGVMRDRGL